MNECKGKILIVDDNEDVLLSLNMLLKPWVEAVRVLRSTERVPEFVENFKPDVILLDMNFSKDVVSGQEGFYWLEKILAIDPQAVVHHRLHQHGKDRASHQGRSGGLHSQALGQAENAGCRAYRSGPAPIQTGRRQRKTL